MPTYNIKTDFSPNAYGDGQQQTLTITINNGDTHLSTTSTGPWSSGDVGKHIAIATSSTVFNSTTTFLSKIDTFTDSQHVILHDAFTPATITNTAKLVEWGHDDVPAVEAFYTANQRATGVQLNFPAGRYCFATYSTMGGGSAFPFFGVVGLHILSSGGNNLAIFSDMLGGAAGLFLGSTFQAPLNNLAYSTPIATVAAGSTTVVATDPTNFTVGKYVLINGLEMQGFGDPNPQFFEYHVITNISGNVITLAAPLKYDYKSTWPAWSTNRLAPSGPGRIHVTSDKILTTTEGVWDAAHIYEGIRFEFRNTDSAFIQFSGRSITILGGSALGECPEPSNNVTFEVDGADWTNAETSEIDKQTVNVTYRNMPIHGIHTQSATPEVMTLDNCHVLTTLNGTGKSVIFENGTIIDASGLQIGPIAYGVATNPTEGVSSCVAADTTFNCEIEIGGTYEDLSSYTISGGVISRDRTYGIPQFGVPGAWIFGTSVGGHGQAYGPAVQITDIYESGGIIHMPTTYAGTGWPPGIAPNGIARTSGAPSLTFTNCDGTSEEAHAWSDYLPARPKGSIWNRTYTTNIATSLDEIRVFGKVLSIQFIVASGYTGGSFNFFSSGGAFVVQMSDASVQLWNPVIALATPGTRTITYNSGSNTYSTVGGDSGLALPGTGAIWLMDDQIFPCMTGMTGSGSIQFIMELDQGIEAEAVVIPTHVCRSIEIHGSTYRYA